MARPLVVVYVSGHGFGHVVRTGAVLAALGDDVDLVVRTNGRALALARGLRAEVTEVDVGPGVAQRGPLESDLEATRAQLAAHLDAFPRLVEAEAAFLRARGARLVLGDVPPLAFAAARRAGVPSVALANFSWSWIYQGFADRDPLFAAAARRFAEAESQADLLLALEPGGGLEVFPNREPIPPLARPLSAPRAELRRRLALDETRPTVLLSLGGFGADQPLAIAPSPRHALLVTSARLEHLPPGARTLDLGHGPTADLQHQDLVAAADCLIGKPGYGTLAEALRIPTAFCYLPRTDFREYAPLAAAIDRWLPSHPLTLESLADGTWPTLVDAALCRRPLAPPPAPDGAPLAASRLRALLGLR